jgi:hypothetical protein
MLQLKIKKLNKTIKKTKENLHLKKVMKTDRLRPAARFSSTSSTFPKFPKLWKQQLN